MLWSRRSVRLHRADQRLHVDPRLASTDLVNRFERFDENLVLHASNSRRARGCAFSRLALLYVVDDSFATGGWSSEIYVPNVPELMENLIADADRRLATLKASAAALGLTAETAVIRGRPAHAIVEHAKNGGFNLIVMGTHGRTGVSHVVMGSVAERVLRKAPCPVLTVRGTEAVEVSAKPEAA